MMNKTMAITKGTLVCGILGLLIMALVIPAAGQESMIPDDFDWSIYIQDWYDPLYEGWGSTPPADDSWSEPFVYDWYGSTGEVPYWQPTAVPEQSWSSDYYTPSYPQQDDWGSSSGYDYSGTGSGSDDGWFYMITDGFYDDFDTWDRSQLPESAYVSGFVGYQQSYNLDCEARSAVDLAAYFGVNISHSEFLYSLPKSDDPNEGFVGSFTDARGNIPPRSYGVYQEPVAELLRRYGLNAKGAYAYTEDALKRQIAAGYPVMVWVVGNTEIGYSVPYTAASTGRTTYVVPYQHTVVVTGYNANGVTIQDGAMRYSRDWNTFLLSWGALGNRAIYVK